MSIRSLFEGLSEVQGALTADASGTLQDSDRTDSALGEQSAAAMAAALSQLAATGTTLGFGPLEMVQVRSDRGALMAAPRGDTFLLVAVDPKRTSQLEKIVQSWDPAASPGSRLPPLPRREPPAQAGPARAEPASDAPTPAPAAAAPRPVAAPAMPPGPIPAPAAARAVARADAWTLLRRTLVRGQLAEAAAQQEELDAASASAGGRAGAEAVPAAERERALRMLLDGIGSVLAGDGVGGGRILRELADASPRNLSFRWIALLWSVRAAIKSGNFTAAGARLKEALGVAKQLDEEAVAVTQWTIADVMSFGRDPGQALPWVAEARTRFERLSDPWGLSRAWLSEARILAAAQRDADAIEASRKASAVDPAWDEPAVFRARRALMRGELAEAEVILERIQTLSASRVRTLIDAVRRGQVTQADAGEYLREHDAPPSARSIRALERIARASPAFSQAREALAWMLVKVGRYADASAIFRGLLARPLSPADRASVMLGLGCIANVEKPGLEPAGLRAAAAAGAGSPPSDPAATPPPLPALSGSSVVQRAGNGGEAAGHVFSGELSVFALPDLLEFLRFGRRTGLLVCSSGRGMGALRFFEGRITGAASPGTPRLGKILVEARKISAAVLAGAARSLGTDPPDHVLGDHLVHESLVDAEALREALERQVGFAIGELLQWTTGEFAFDREGDATPPRGERAAAVDVQGALMRAFKDMDESGSISAPAGAR